MDRVTHGRRTFVLREPIEAQPCFAEGLWNLEHRSLGLHGYGETPEGAREALALDLAAAWDGVAREDDERLTLDAQELKQRLLAAVRRVETTADPGV